MCRKASKLDYIGYEEMLELAGGGAKVLHPRSVSLAKKFKVPLVVASSFSEEPGTEIVEEYKGMEDAVVSGITFKNDEARITIRDLPDVPGISGKIFERISQEGVIVDMIVQSKGVGGHANISFTVPRESAQLTFDSLQELLKSEIPDASIQMDKDIAKLSVVGEGMRTHSGVASKVFEIMGAENINIEMITTSEIKISLAIEEKYTELAVRALHEYFIENDGP